MAKSKKSNLMVLEQRHVLDRAPPELIEQLERMIQAAKDGNLAEAIISYYTDDGREFLPGGRMFFRADGRMDAIHSTCHLLAHEAMMELQGGPHD